MNNGMLISSDRAVQARTGKFATATVRPEILLAGKEVFPCPPLVFEGISLV
jgi:hypothetical protein